MSAEDALEWIERGMLLDEDERHDEALAAYTRALELAPENAEAWGLKGNAISILTMSQAGPAPATSWMRWSATTKRWPRSTARSPLSQTTPMRWSARATR